MHGVEFDMTIWWVASVTPPLKNPGYAPDNAVKAFEYAVREKCFKSQLL